MQGRKGCWGYLLEIFQCHGEGFAGGQDEWTGGKDVDKEC